jgi:hypothetical protein
LFRGRVGRLGLRSCPFCAIGQRESEEKEAKETQEWKKLSLSFFREKYKENFGNSQGQRHKNTNNNFRHLI